MRKEALAMARFPAGMLVLFVVSILIYFGLGQRVLDRMRLSDRAALAIIAAIIIGSFVDIPITPRLTINLGGIIPVGVAVYVLAGAGTAFEKVRGILAAAVTAVVLYGAGRVLGAEPENMLIDPLYVYPLVAGLVGYIAGRSRRGAFFAAVMGVFALDVIQYAYLIRTGTRGVVHMGGAGAFDALVLAGILAVLLAEGIGELLERIQGGPDTDDRSEALLKHLREPEPSAVPARKPIQEEDNRDE